MIVEDEGITAMVIQSSLEKMGYSVTSLEVTGEDAVKKAALEKPDLILMDISLIGEMNGITAAEQIYTRFNIPIVYITAHSNETILRNAKKIAPFRHLVKPVDNDELRIAIEAAL
jgi:CheY-like chemotaxis protein